MKKVLGASAALVLAMGCSWASAAAKEVTIGYVDGWSDSVATTHVAAEVIKQKLGYDVKLQAVATGIMWQGVATGKLDAMLSAWLPVTHGEYWSKNQDKVVDYGPNFKDAKIGLIVPEYVKAKSIEDLKTDDTFKNRIVGIDAGAGVMLKTEQAIKDYGLSGYKLQASSGAGMIAELTRAGKRPAVHCRDRLGSALDVRQVETALPGRSEGRLRRGGNRQQHRQQGSGQEGARGRSFPEEIPVVVQGRDRRSDAGHPGRRQA
ncbi:ABC-type proline/glycine betaine transport system substrate-binding protein [Pseudomonas sp. PvP001]